MIGPAKSVAVVFTHKRIRIDKLQRLWMSGAEIPFEKTVKYLGVILDSKLTFREHVLQMCKKATRLQMAAKNAVGQLWGPSLRTMRWVYEAIVRPMITYGSVVWAHKIPVTYPPLQRIQRLALLSMGQFLKSTPTAGLEVLLNVLPLDLYVKQEARSTAARLGGVAPDGWDGVGHGRKRGHILVIWHVMGQYAEQKRIELRQFWNGKVSLRPICLEKRKDNY